jgi:multiple sugar transport system permease protein
MLLYQSGPINDLISRISGIDFKPMWLTDPNIALPTVMLLEIWNWAPFSFIRILSETRMFQLLMLRMIPPIVIVAPLSLYYSTLGLLDSMTGLILIYFLTTLPYAVWMTKSFIDEVPREIEQAAEILGASRWRTIFEIVLPLIRSGLVATFLFILILTWSEYLLALIITKTQVTTLPIELSKYQGTTEGRVYGRQAALAVGITIPLMIVGLVIRKQLARGFSFGMVRR